MISKVKWKTEISSAPDHLGAFLVDGVRPIREIEGRMRPLGHYSGLSQLLLKTASLDAIMIASSYDILQ